MRFLVFSLVALVGGLFGSLAFAAEPAGVLDPVALARNNAGLQERMMALEKRLEWADQRLREKEDLLVQTHAARSKVLKETLEFESRVTLERNRKLLEEKNEETLGRFLWIFGGLTVLLVAFFTLIMKPMVEIRAKKEVGRAIKGKKKVVNKMIADADWTLKAKKKRIVLIGSEAEGLSSLKKQLDELGFGNVEQKLISKLTAEYEPVSGDLVIFNEDVTDLAVKNTGEESLINRYLRDSGPKDVFVCYYTKPGHVPVLQRDKVNFANSAITLHARIMETLSYADQRS